MRSEFGLNKGNDEPMNSKLMHVHPKWRTFIKYCESMKNGEIEKLKIQDGLPVLAEEVKRKIQFERKK